MRSPGEVLSLCTVLVLAGAGAGAALLASIPAPPGQWRTLAGQPRDAAGLEARMRRLMAEHRVPALSVAVVAGGRTVFARTLGVVGAGGVKLADEHTVFRAASLSKPVFAYLVMRLVDEGVLALDTPVYRLLPKPLHEYPAYASLKGDSRYEHLTARILLSHQGGLPNWRRERPDGPIGFNSNPGERFSYSGEGYALLQLAIETVTGRDLTDLADEKVFVPLGMTDTSFLWEPRFDGRFAVDLGSPLGDLIADTRRKSVAAASVITNASDYAKFLSAVMNGTGLSPATHAAMQAPQVALTSKSLFSAPGTDGGANLAVKLAWTPGWGTFEDANGRALFHLGLEEGCEDFAELFPGRRIGIVIVSQTTGLDTFTAPLVDYAIGTAFSPLAWLEYGEAAGRWRSRVGVFTFLGATAAGTIALAVWLFRRPGSPRRT
jgi:CubicO group peptidase (beta-lactamase class C family)